MTEQVFFCSPLERRWLIKHPMESVTSPACQIHHTHSDHWVATIFHKDKIYLLDSLGTERKDDIIIPGGLKKSSYHKFMVDKKMKLLSRFQM